MTGLPPQQDNAPKTTRRRDKSNGQQAIRSCAATTHHPDWLSSVGLYRPTTGRIAASWDIDEHERHEEERSGAWDADRLRLTDFDVSGLKHFGQPAR
jgi:hypothetical protein